jgi:anthranilate phosphoribosyltransferase
MTPAPNPLRDVLLKVCAREDLTRDEARAAFLHIMSGEASESVVGGLLVGLAAKGTTVDELVGAATVMREKAVPVDCGSAAGGVIVDTCGTGGSRLRMGGMFNVSTATALIAAGAGVKVVKHGNRSASSKAGSADVLEKLGVKLELSPQQTTACLEAAGVCFAFARSHHPAMRFVAPVRTALGIPTIFNLLGPLTNPAKARHQLLGVFAPELTGKLAQVLRDLGAQRAWVVHAEDGLDELSTLGPTRVGELRDGHVTDWTLDPKSLGLEYARLSDLKISGVDEAAAALRAVLGGEKGPRRDIATLNAAAALVVAGRVGDLQEGLRVAGEVLDAGLARKALEALVRASNA